MKIIRVDRRDRLHDLLLQGNGRKQRMTVPKPNPAAAIRAKSFLALQELAADPAAAAARVSGPRPSRHHPPGHALRIQRVPRRLARRRRLRRYAAIVTAMSSCTSA